MNNLLGDWQATKDVPTYMGFSVFTIPRGAIISVSRYDSRGKKRDG